MKCSHIAIPGDGWQLTSAVGHPHHWFGIDFVASDLINVYQLAIGALSSIVKRDVQAPRSWIMKCLVLFSPLISLFIPPRTLVMTI